MDLETSRIEMIEDIKTYSRIDTEYEDNLIYDLILAAEIYLENAGIKPNYENAQYRLCLKMIVNENFDNRTLNGTIGIMFRSIISQLSASQKEVE